MSKYLNLNSRSAVHHSYIASNFTYCPLIWHFCGRTNDAKLGKIQERSLRILFKEDTSPYEDLLPNTGLSTLLFNRLKCLLLETFNPSDAECLHGIVMFGISRICIRSANFVWQIGECSGNQSRQMLRELLSAHKQLIISFQSFWLFVWP